MILILLVPIISLSKCLSPSKLKVIVLFLAMILCHCLRWNENSLVKLPQSYWGQLTVCHQIPQSIQGQFKSLGIPVTDFSVFLMLEKTLKSPLDCKEIKPVNLKGNQF